VEFVEIQRIKEPWKIFDEAAERIALAVVNKWLRFLIGL
jgi:hypothetical protein